MSQRLTEDDGVVGLLRASPPAISIIQMDPDDSAGSSEDPSARHGALVSCRSQGCEARHSLGYLNIGRVGDEPTRWCCRGSRKVTADGVV